MSTYCFVCFVNFLFLFRFWLSLSGQRLSLKLLNFEECVLVPLIFGLLVFFVCFLACFFPAVCISELYVPSVFLNFLLALISVSFKRWRKVVERLCFSSSAGVSFCIDRAVVEIWILNPVIYESAFSVSLWPVIVALRRTLKKRQAIGTRTPTTELVVEQSYYYLRNTTTRTNGKNLMEFLGET